MPIETSAARHIYTTPHPRTTPTSSSLFPPPHSLPSNITMSTPNVGAAVRSRASNTPKPSNTLGFDVVAKHLTDHFHTVFNIKAEKCRGVNSHAHKHLISSFTAPLKGVKASVSTAVSTITHIESLIAPFIHQLHFYHHSHFFPLPRRLCGGRLSYVRTIAFP
jgi:hypothetical protein